jgi:hypothetical protein
MFPNMTSTVHDDHATTVQGGDTPVVVRQPGTGGVHEWLPYAVAALSAVLLVLMFIAIGNQHSGSSAASKPAPGVVTGPQLTTTLAPTSFTITCTLTKGPGYQSVAGQITSNASSAADVTVTYDVLDAAGTRVLGSTKVFKGIAKGTPAPWQSSERGTPAGANCTAKITAVTAAG